MNSFDAWCKRAVSQIRYKPDQQAVFDELKAHLEDHFEDLLTQGYSIEEAKRLALEAMGSAEEIAPQLGQIHKPFWGYVYSVVKVAAIITSFLALFLLIAASINHFHARISIAGFKSLEEEGQGGYYCEPNVSVTCEGYRFRVAEAAINAEGDTLHLELQTMYWPWMRECQIYDHIWAVDSLGNVYSSRWEANYANIPKLKWGGGYFTGNLAVQGLCLTQFDSEAQWVELRYDRDGREIVLHIDLTGGEAQ